MTRKRKPSDFKLGRNTVITIADPDPDCNWDIELKWWCLTIDEVKKMKDWLDRYVAWKEQNQ